MVQTLNQIAVETSVAASGISFRLLAIGSHSRYILNHSMKHLGKTTRPALTALLIDTILWNKSKNLKAVKKYLANDLCKEAP